MNTSNEIPDCPTIDYCHCYPAQEREANQRGETHCVCGETEKALRAWGNCRIKTPMTAKQREWCLNEIESVEGHERKDYEKESDGNLALAVLCAWTEYCQDKGLL